MSARGSGADEEMDIETIEGRRLVLRALREADAADLSEAVEASRPALKRRLGWASRPTGLDEERRFAERAGAAASEGRGLVWGMFDGKGTRLAGVISLCPLDSARSQGSLGMWVRADRQDKGYAAEAGRLVLDQAFRRAGLHRVSARLDPANRPFRKVLKKLGFRYEGCLRCDNRLNGRWVDQECWGILKAEWKR